MFPNILQPKYYICHDNIYSKKFQCLEFNNFHDAYEYYDTALTHNKRRKKSNKYNNLVEYIATFPLNFMPNFINTWFIKLVTKINN